MIKGLILSAFLLLTFSLPAIAQKERNNTSRWVESDDSKELSVTTRNDVSFNDDYTDVINVSSDGYFEVRDRQNGVTRELRIVSGADGQLVRTYKVNGETRAFDAEAKNWLTKMLAAAVRKGFDARNRAVKLVRQRGAAAVVKEVPNLEGDYTKRVYLEEALKTGTLDSNSIQEVLRIAEREISSDYEKASLLINAINASPGNRNSLNAYFAAADTIKSDYERGRVLKAALKTNSSNKEILMPTLVSAKKISSDYEKANIVIYSAGVAPAEGNLMQVYFEVIDSIKSDYEHGRVLKTFLKNNPENKDILMMAVASAAKMTSDYEKANILLQISRSNVQDERLRNVLLSATKTISSDYERGRVLNSFYLKDTK